MKNKSLNGSKNKEYNSSLDKNNIICLAQEYTPPDAWSEIYFPGENVPIIINKNIMEKELKEKI